MSKPLKRRQHILITSGPTRQYLDPVRYITNASSGRMGASLAQAALQRGHKVTVVSGPVTVDYPAEANVVDVVTTDDMLQAASDRFRNCDGVIGAAAPCDYQPRKVLTEKIAKTGDPLRLDLLETADVIATLGQKKRTDQWVVGFALETDDHRFRAIVKLERKHCDLIVSNTPAAIDAVNNHVELINASGALVDTIIGSKAQVADRLLHHIDDLLIQKETTT
ncbi:MAG: phosphopantothenoylcysteine decarboxylase [Planctomycetota bacterium]